MNGEIAILTAMPKEAAAIRRNIGRLLDERRDLSLSVTGVCKVSAAMAAQELITCKNIDLAGIVIVGCAGSIHPLLQLGGIALCESSGYWDVDCGKDCEPGQVQGWSRWFDAHPDLTAHIQAQFKRDEIDYLKGFMLTGDSFLSEEQGATLHARYPECLTVDMETAAIAQVCRRYSVPYACVRVASDTLSPEEKRQREYGQFWSVRPQRRFSFGKSVAKGALEWASRR